MNATDTPTMEDRVLAAVRNAGGPISPSDVIRAVAGNVYSAEARSASAAIRRLIEANRLSLTHDLKLIPFPTISAFRFFMP